MLAENIHFCVQCGTKLTLQEKMGRTRPTCPACGWIFFPDPKVAAGVVVLQAHKVLLVRRVYNPQRGYWTLPVGFIDAGEDPARAAERECQEETGLVVKTTRLLDVIYGQTHRRGAHFVIFYAAEWVSGQLQAQDDADQVGFFPLDALPPLAFESTKAVLQNYLQQLTPNP